MTAARKHPRVCGEDLHMVEGSQRVLETPPRMRGRRGGDRLKAIRGRNTPAYAGKTLPSGSGTIRRRKHPRVCGEDDLSGCLRNPCRETPPRMRGRRSKSEKGPLDAGNTPAYAGKTWPASATTFYKMETPPRMRGRHMMTR